MSHEFHELTRIKEYRFAKKRVHRKGAKNATAYASYGASKRKPKDRKKNHIGLLRKKPNTPQRGEKRKENLKGRKEKEAFRGDHTKGRVGPDKVARENGSLKIKTLTTDNQIAVVVEQRASNWKPIT